MDTAAGDSVDSTGNSLPMSHHHRRRLPAGSAAGYNEPRFLPLFRHVDHLVAPGRLPDRRLNEVNSQRQAVYIYRARQLYKNISMLFLFPVKDGKLSTGVIAIFNATI